MGWRFLRGLAAAIPALSMLASSTFADAWDDCKSADADRSIGGCTAIIEAGTDTVENVAIAYSNRGNDYRSKGDYDRALKDYDRAIALDPKNAQAYYNRGLAYSGKGDYNRSIQDFDRAIALDPKYAKAYHIRGVAYQIKGDHDRAIKDYDRAIELDPTHANSYVNRGIAYSEKGNYDRAIKDYDRAIALDPKDEGGAHYSRCWTRAWAGTNLDLARADCDAALALANDPYTLAGRGLVGIKQGLFDKAWADYDAAHQAEPVNAEFLYGRGIAALRLGRTAEGNADLAKAMERNGKIADIYTRYGVPLP